MNPVNKCSQLFSVNTEELVNPVHQMFEMQKSLQDKLASTGKGLNFDKSTHEEKVQQIIVEWKNITLEMAELIERLPHKSWKTYTSEQKSGWENDEQKLETWYEYIDVFHFFMNVGLLLGITPDDFIKLYVTKNKENFDRQKRGY